MKQTAEEQHTGVRMQAQTEARHANVLPLIRTARGHLGGIEQMIQDNRYCIDISNQLQAVIAILRKADAQILRTHMETCVRESAAGGDFEQKLKELESVIDHLVGES